MRVRGAPTGPPRTAAPRHHRRFFEKKIINDPQRLVDEMLNGLLLAHPDQLRAASADHRAIVRADSPKAGRVGIVTGCGSGHLPAFLRSVGEGLCSAVASQRSGA